VVTPTSVTQTVCDDSERDGVGATFDIDVPAGTTRCLMFFGCLGDITGLGNTISGAIEAAPLFNSNALFGDLLSGLSPTELEECLNWDFVTGDNEQLEECKASPSGPIAIIPTMGQWGMIFATIILGIFAVVALRRRIQI